MPLPSSPSTSTPAARRDNWRSALGPRPDALPDARPAAPLSVVNADARTVWLSYVPQDELDALSVSLARGPVDGNFFLALQGRLVNTPLLLTMAEALVRDGLPTLLPPSVTARERDAWQQVLVLLLTCSRPGWEVACLPLRARLSADVASTSRPLRILRDALYRPFDLPGAAWQSRLSTQRARGVDDCRTIAIGCQPTRDGALADDAWLRAGLRQVAPMLDRDQLQRGVTQAVRRAADDAGLLDPRLALPDLFDRTDLAGRRVLDDAARIRVLRALGELDCAGSDGRGSRLPSMQGAPGARLADELVDVACRTAIERQGSWRVQPPPALLALSGLHTGLQLGLGWLGAPAALLPVGPGDAAALVPTGAGTVAHAAASMPLQATSDTGQRGIGPAASSAPRCSDGSLLGMAAGTFISGVSLMRLGWNWMVAGGGEAGSGGTIAPSTPVREAESCVVTDGAVELLGNIVDVEGNATLWSDILRRVNTADAADATDLIEQVGALLVRNGVADRVVATLDADAEQLDAAGAHGNRVRRDNHDLNPIAGPAAIIRQEVVAQGRLAQASRRLIEAARKASPAVHAPSAVDFQPGDGLPDAEAVGMIRFWQHTLDAQVETREGLAQALVELEGSDRILAYLHAGMPDLDAHIGAQLSATLNGTLGVAIDPREIHRNTFQRSELWETWAAAHPRPPSLRERPGNRTRHPGQRVRSGLVSSYSLVEAAVLPQEHDGNRTALYLRSGQGTYFPNQECERPTLAQFNDAIAGRDFIDEFVQLHSEYVEGANATARNHDMDLFWSAFNLRLVGSSILMIAGGRVSARANWLVSTVLRYPAQFDGSNPANGRALVLPNADLRVYPLMASNVSDQALPLHGVMLLREEASDGGATVLISSSRTPAMEQFDSADDALRQLEIELPRRLDRWVGMQHHHHWQPDRNATVTTAAEITGDFLEALFRQELSLRQQQLQYLRAATGAVARRDFNAFAQKAARYPTAVPLPLLRAGAQVAAGTPAHWLVGPANGRGATLRNVDFNGVVELYDLNASRSMLERRYPLLPRYVEDALDDAVMTRHGVTFDSGRYAIVSFSGGTRSSDVRSGWIHSADQRTGSQSLVECALGKGEGLPEGEAIQELSGLYLAPDNGNYDATTEATEIGPDQFLAIARSLDLQRDYLAALSSFWTEQLQEVLFTVHGSYVFSAWQQYAEGSLSERGLQIALGAVGRAASGTAADTEVDPVMGPGVRAGWLEVYGMPSTIVQLQDDHGEEVLLYYPNEQNRFYEFAHPLEMVGWLRRVSATAAGYAWFEPAFDLRDLQDGWFYSGVESVLGGGEGSAFEAGRTARLIDGVRLVSALVGRLRARTESDALVLITSNWQLFRHHWLGRMQQFNMVVGLASIVLPPLLPVVAVGSATELGLGAEQAIDGRSEAERSAGGRAAAGAAIGLGTMVPLGVSRLVHLAAADGARAQVGVQAVIDGAAVDPLRGLADRYAQPRYVDGVRPAGNGVYRFAGRHYIRQADHTYEVFFDGSAHTWRMRQPAEGIHYAAPIRLNVDGVWEPNPDVGLRGGAPDESISRSVSIESSYRGALNAHLNKVRAGATDVATDDFKWGVANWRRVRITNSEMSIPALKHQFVEGGLDAVQKGALSEIISRLEALQRSGWYARLGFDIEHLVHRAGGRFFPVSQALLFEDIQIGGAGVCTGLSRIMTVAMAEDAQLQLVRNLRAAVTRPGSRLATTVRSMALDAQGAALPAHALSESEQVDAEQLAGLLGGVTENSQFILSGSSHSLSVAVRVAPNGRRVYSLYDPNFGLVEFTGFAEFHRWLPAYFRLRPITPVPGSSEVRPLSLSELYGASGSAEGQGQARFGLRQVGTAVMRQQAVERHWDQLLHRISSP